MTDRRVSRRLTVLLLVVASMVAWWAWTAWDLQYDVDPLTGRESGPWSAWQVGGSVLTLLGVVVLATRRLSPLIVVAVVPLAYTAAWIATAVSNDDQGLWPIGAFLVLVGTTAGTALVAPVAAMAHRGLARRRPA